MAKQPQANKPITKSPRGRPSSYTREVADEILRRIVEGESLKRICASEGMPPMQTSLRWASDDIDGFRDRYTRAMQARAHQWAEEIGGACRCCRPR